MHFLLTVYVFPGFEVLNGSQVQVAFPFFCLMGSALNMVRPQQESQKAWRLGPCIIVQFHQRFQTTIVMGSFVLSMWGLPIQGSVLTVALDYVKLQKLFRFLSVGFFELLSVWLYAHFL